MNSLPLVQYFILLVGVFVGVWLSLKFLIYISSRPDHVAGRAIRIPSRKSSTDAIQLGGAPVSFAIGLGALGLLFLLKLPSIQIGMIKVWIACSALIVVYGYLDDKFELRPIIKLLAQLFAINIFAIYASFKLSPEYSTLAFLVLSFWGMGVVNGANLLDGLDTLTVKLCTVTYGAYCILGIYYQVPVVTVFALVCFAALGAFYFFNREPAKVHLGEIGGAYIGFTFVLLSSLLFTGSHSSFLSNIGVVLMPLSLPMVEVGISFSRRLINKKSPFKGDKLHVHHLLRYYYDFSVLGTTWIMTLGYSSIMLIALGLSFIHGIAGFIIITLGLSLLSSMIGSRYWLVMGRSISLTPMNLVRYMTKRQITLIEPSVSDDFQLLIEDHDQINQQILQ